MGIEDVQVPRSNFDFHEYLRKWQVVEMGLIHYSILL
jgi:hypothetical protein